VIVTENIGIDCDWALPHPARTEADRDMALRATERNQAYWPKQKR
jgi:hypothetical protein